MAARNPLVVIAGQVQELPSGDTVTGGGSGDGTVSNVIAVDTTIAADTSYVVVGYLTINAGVTFTMNGNLGVI